MFAACLCVCISTTLACVLILTAAAAAAASGCSLQSSHALLCQHIQGQGMKQVLSSHSKHDTSRMYILCLQSDHVEGSKHTALQQHGSNDGLAQIAADADARVRCGQV